MTKHDLRIVFMGTPDFAVETLSSILHRGYNVVAAVTAPDKPAGRGKKLQQSPVKLFALENGLQLLQPVNLKDANFIEQLIALGPDVIVVVAFRMLPKAVWNIPPYGTFNLHASLLPQYRGAAPINWALINGESQTGVTTFFIDEEIDTGRIILQEKTPIQPDDTAGTIHDKLMTQGADLVCQTLELLISDRLTTFDQKHIPIHQIKSAPKIFKEDCQINWNNDPERIYNFIRGLSPYPAAFSDLVTKNGTILNLKIFIAHPEYGNHENKPGSVISDYTNYIKVACNGGYLDLKEIQPAGKNRMKTSDFLRGLRISG